MLGQMGNLIGSSCGYDSPTTLERQGISSAKWLIDADCEFVMLSIYSLFMFVPRSEVSSPFSLEASFLLNIWAL